jgi:hypothetical protein
MDLRVRPMEKADIDRCVDLLCGHAAYPEALIALLPRAWKRLLRDDALNAVVVERVDLDLRSRPVCFAASVVVSEAWMTEAWVGREPYLTRRTICAELSDRSPILRRDALLRRLNAGPGVDVLILHYAETPAPLSRDDRAALRFFMWQSFIETTRGYRINRIVQEFWDEIDQEYVLHGWGRVLTDYVDWFAAQGIPMPPLGSRPHLLGVSREEVRRRPGDIAAPLFVYTSPRIFFSRAEQRLLRSGLGGRTDADLAEHLGVGLPTIKTTWRNVYLRVARMAPEVLPEPKADRERSARQREKRRSVLEYVRRHPEELRPDLVVRNTSSRRRAPHGRR